MSSTFKPRLSQISLSIATDKVDNLLSCTKLQMLRESATIGCRKAISSSTTAWSFKCKDSFSAAFWWSSSSLSGSSCYFDELFLILAARREKKPATCLGERTSLPRKRWAPDSFLTLCISFDTSFGSAFFPRSSPMTNCSVINFFCSSVNWVRFLVVFSAHLYFQRFLHRDRQLKRVFVLRLS